MKQFLTYLGVTLFVFAFGWAYHIALNWMASLISWEGTTIGSNILVFFVVLFIVGVGKINSDYDEQYMHARIQGLEDEQERDKDIIHTLTEQLDQANDLKRILTKELNEKIDLLNESRDLLTEVQKKYELTGEKARAIRIELTEMKEAMG